MSSPASRFGPNAGRATGALRDERAASAAPERLGGGEDEADRRARSRWPRRCTARTAGSVVGPSWPRASGAACWGVCSGAASDCVVAAVRWLSRGAAIASKRKPEVERLTRVCRTVVMIDVPPGEPTASTGRSAQDDRRAIEEPGERHGFPYSGSPRYRRGPRRRSARPRGVECRAGSRGGARERLADPPLDRRADVSERLADGRAAARRRPIP